MPRSSRENKHSTPETLITVARKAYKKGQYGVGEGAERRERIKSKSLASELISSA